MDLSGGDYFWASSCTLQGWFSSLLVLISVLASCLRSFRSVDTSTMIHKHVPDFCTVYVISKGKVSYARKAIRPAPRQANSLLDLEDHHHAISLHQTWTNPSAEQESNRGMRHQTMKYSRNSSNSSSSSRPSIDRLFTQQTSDRDFKFLDDNSLDGEEIQPNIPVRHCVHWVSLPPSEDGKIHSSILEFFRKKWKQRCRGSDYSWSRR